jgi:hypothetical protein
MQEDRKQKVEKLAKQFGVPVESVEMVLLTREAANMREKTEFFQKERAGIEQGDPEAIKKQHEKGRLTARERVAKLLDPGSFNELDIWRRPFEVGYPGKKREEETASLSVSGPLKAGKLAFGHRMPPLWVALWGQFMPEK